MDKLDVVIVGAGLSGLACAYRLAEKNMQVVVVERGDFPGAKNVTGGRLYMNPIKDMVGDMFEGAPFERKIVRERWSFLGDGNSLNMDLTGDNFRRQNHSFSLLRATFDRWLAEKLMEKGIFVIPKYRVDDLLWEGGTVAGVKAGQEELWARVVVASDGVLSFMGEKAGLRQKMTPRNYALGIKEVIELPEQTISDRFNVEPGEGVAHLFLGDVTKGLFGGGFLYTNRASVSLGVVVGIKALMESGESFEAHTVMDRFKERYEVKTFIRDGRLSEYAAHVIPEGGLGAMGKLCGNGILLTGDAAGFALNMGVTVRGMEFAIASGIMAAETILKAKEGDDFSEQSLARYEARLKETFVLQDMQTCRNMPDFLDNDAWFDFYPKCLPDLLEKIMWFEGGPKAGIGKTAWNHLKASGMLSFKKLMELYKIKNL